MTWIMILIAMSMVFGWGQTNRSRRRLSRQEESRIAALEAEIAGRDDSIVALESRVAELESRLDFAERMLSTPRERETV